uniref:Ubiquitin-like protease family profile domain-containing protein n=1 Tax=Oryza rufipogon TaxID=4529 RepID=A0A0E0NDB1_ORYRU
MAGERRKPLVVRDGRRIRSYSPRSAGGMGPRPHPLLFAKIQLTKKEDPFITYFNKTKDNKVMVHIEEVKVNRKSMKVLTEPEYLNDDVKKGIRGDGKAFLEQAIKTGLLNVEGAHIFLPTNITEIHWYLAILNAKRREVQILDSLAKPISEHRPRTRACAIERGLHGTKFHHPQLKHDCPDFDITKWEHNEVKKLPKQGDKWVTRKLFHMIFTFFNYASRVAYTPLSSWSIGADLISQKIKYRQLQ